MKTIPLLSAMLLCTATHSYAANSWTNHKTDHSDNSQKASMLPTFTIDGNKSDWQSFQPLFMDPQGNTICDGQSDIKFIYYTTDGSYAYIMVETYAPLKNTDTIEINFDYKEGQHCCSESTADLHTNVSKNSFSAWTDEDLNGTLENASVSGVVTAWGEVFEMKIPLAQFGNPTQFMPVFVNTWDYNYSNLENNGCNPVEISTTIKSCWIPNELLKSTYNGSYLNIPMVSKNADNATVSNFTFKKNSNNTFSLIKSNSTFNGVWQIKYTKNGGGTTEEFPMHFVQSQNNISIIDSCNQDTTPDKGMVQGKSFSTVVNDDGMVIEGSLIGDELSGKVLSNGQMIGTYTGKRTESWICDPNRN
ncbi:MAG: hypothetical protein H7832_12245 [Magnetococcus sp. DMHC-6]